MILLYITVCVCVQDHIFTHLLTEVVLSDTHQLSEKIITIKKIFFSYKDKNIILTNFTIQLKSMSYKIEDNAAKINNAVLFNTTEIEHFFFNFMFLTLSACFYPFLTLT